MTGPGASTAPITGTCRRGFESVGDAFARNFAERGEVGASVCIMVGGEIVVDLAGGWADAERTRPFEPGTLVNVYSVGKAMVATLALQLVDQGELTLDEPLVRVWPEIEQHGKGRLTLRHALTHQAGLPAIREPLTNEDLWDWDRMVAALAATEPWWEPGTDLAYHTNTFGHLVGEVVRRVTGVGVGARLRQLADALGADVWIGLPADEHARCAEVIFHGSSETPIDATAFPAGWTMQALSYFNPPGYSSIGVVNTAAWRSAEIPATNGHATARGLARFYDALLHPGLVLSAELRDEAARPHVAGPCPILGEEAVFGLGFTPTTARRPFGTNPRSFGHFGTGGALGFADPDAGVAFGYVMNDVIPRWQSTRNRALIDSLYTVV